MQKSKSDQINTPENRHAFSLSSLPLGESGYLGAFYSLYLFFFLSDLVWSELNCWVDGQDYGVQKFFMKMPSVWLLCSN